MKALAIKKGQTRERAPAFKEMGTLRCDSCGDEFIVWHDPSVADNGVAMRQALWLEKGSCRGTRTGTEACGSHPTAGLAHEALE